jgi:hypothetical protein
VSIVGTAALLGGAAACQTAISREAEDALRHARAPARAGASACESQSSDWSPPLDPAQTQFCSWAMPRADSKRAATWGWRAETPSS